MSTRTAWTTREHALLLAIVLVLLAGMIPSCLAQTAGQTGTSATGASAPPFTTPRVGG